MNPNQLTVALCLIFGLSACATEPTQQSAQTDSTPPKTIPSIPAQAPLVPAIHTRLTAATVAQYMNDLHKEIEQALAGNATLEIERFPDHSIKLTASNEASFDFNQSEVKPDFQSTLDKITGPVQRATLTTLTVIGHTDSTGDPAYNQALSLKRADAVSNHLQGAGIAAGRLTTDGRGETEPRISNATEAGRQLNRRVEILIRPVLAE